MTAALDGIKKDQLGMLADYRKKLYRKPWLRYLFLELTLRCNEYCMHCGSGCGDVRSEELPLSEYQRILDEVKADFPIRDIQLCITGGEPLMRSDFFDIMAYAHRLGFQWGMTSNAVLIDREAARKLRETGMKTISVSIDGLRETHDRFRGLKGAYDGAMRGLENLIEEGGFAHIQVTTVLHHTNMDELEPLYDILRDMDIDSWRVIGVEPIGRALQNPELLLTDEDQIRLFDFIREKRMEHMPVTYGCSHFLGLDYEKEVREHYFICNAGVYLASIMCNGDIGACLDIERRPELIQGNIKKDRLKDVWENRFQIFREGLDTKSGRCRDCEVREYCAGGSAHSWDYDRNEQRICFKDLLRMN